MAENIRNGNLIHADPSKSFFIDMLTRDISLDECILDLADNSIHSLIRRANLDVMKILLGKSLSRRNTTYELTITFTAKDFRIEDTCGGISIDDARNEVFLFGTSRKETKYTGLGVYGIGMKRAFFKLGRNIAVESRTDREEFKVDIDVEQWQKEPKWEFEFTYARRTPKSRKIAGTVITVTHLNPSVGKYFEQAPFQNELIRKLSSTYALFLKTGLTIKLNGTSIKPRLPQLLESQDLKPVRRLFKQDGVDVLIVAGITPKHDRDPHGWYVFCNGRMVLEAEKTELTGWGENKFPQFHSKYNHFLGMVYFRSTDLRLLPWTTTKDGVEKESPVYQSALGQMRVLAKPITDFLNTMYPGDVPLEDRPAFELLENARMVSVASLAKDKNSTFLAKTSPVKPHDDVHISYVKPLREVNKVRDALRDRHLSNKGVGEKTFEYFVRKECS
jgi:hypothetical protein